MSILERIIKDENETALAVVWPVSAQMEGHMKRLPTYKPPFVSPHVQNVQDLLTRGYTRVEIGKRLGISTTTVSGIVARNNLQWPRKKPARERIDADQLRELLASGMKWDDIAEELGEAVTTVRRRAEDLGLITMDHRNSKRCNIDADTLRKLAATDMTWGEIAEELGEPRHNVRRRARDLGIRRA